MATTANITLSSSIMPNFSGYSKTMTLRDAGTSVDIKETTGYSRRKLSSATKVDLVTMANLIVGEDTTNLSHKIFIKNIGHNGVVDKTTGVKVLINSVEIGVLYGNDWLLMPVIASNGEDIEVHPLTDDTVTLEWIMFYKGA
tara:strand:- start:535 stop:960 length:426 start_codon:yes stop_codon:yes gene_type:complete